MAIEVQVGSITIQLLEEHELRPVCIYVREKGDLVINESQLRMRETGMRNERELFQVRIENINWDTRRVFVPESKTKSGRREVPMSDEVYQLPRARCGTGSECRLFPSHRAQSGHLTTIGKHFRQARRKAGLPEELVLYCGRHDFGSRVYGRTGNLKLVMNVMGHRDVKTAMRYQHPDLEAARAALNAGSGLEKAARN